MKKRIVYTSLIILSSLILLWATLNWIYGSKAQKFIDSQFILVQSSLKQIAPDLSLLTVGREKGILSSRYTFELRQQSTKKSLLRINFDISHGPFVRFNQLGLANGQIDFVLLPEGKKLLPISLTKTIKAQNNVSKFDPSKSKNDESTDDLKVNNFFGNLLILDNNSFEISINLPYLNSQNLLPIKLVLEQPVFKYNQTDISAIPLLNVLAQKANVSGSNIATEELEIVMPNLTFGISQAALSNTKRDTSQENSPINFKNILMPKNGLKSTILFNAESLKASNMMLNKLSLETEIQPSKKNNLSSMTIALTSQDVIYKQSKIGKIESKFFVDHINFLAFLELFNSADLRYKTAVSEKNAIYPKYVYYFAQWLERAPKILADQPSFGITPIRIVNETGEFNLVFDWRLQTEDKLATLNENSSQINNRILRYLLSMTQSFNFEININQPLFAKLVEQFLLQQNLFEKNDLNDELHEKQNALLFALNEMNNTKPFVTFSLLKDESKQEDNKQVKEEQMTNNSTNTKKSFLSDKSILNISFKYDVNKNQVMLNHNKFSVEQFIAYLSSVGI